MIHNPSLMHTKIVLPISKTCMTIAAAKPPGLIITSLISPHPTLTAIAFWYLVIMIGHPQYSLYTTLLMLLHVIKSLWSHQSVLMMGRSLELSPVLNTFLRNQTTFMMRLWCIHQFWPDTHSCSVMKFQAGTYQTRSFAELTPKFQTCGTQSHKFQAPSPTPITEILVPLTTSTQACATWWLTRFDWLCFLQWCAISLTQRNETKSHEWAPRSCSNCSRDSCSRDSSCPASKSSDNFVRALVITID
jgi:hypothetical protein